MKETIIYRVYGCDTGGYDNLNAEFTDAVDACTYAVAQCGIIHYGLPRVKKYTYRYNPNTYTVTTDKVEILTEKQIYDLSTYI